VLDAAGRIQVYDMDGRLLIGWTMDVRWPAEPKLGGQGYLAWLPKAELLIGVIGDQAIAYTIDSEEVGRFELEDGTPSALTLDKKGKQLLMAFGDELVLYNTDGFRFGTVIDLGEYTSGFESVDMTLDEDRRLWVLTDTGWLYKFKKPGKLDFSIRITDRPLIHPRIAVYDGILYMTNNNEIQRVDVLQLLLDRAAAEEDAEKAE
jgi:outer membrane protein assembly factor BamB